MNVTVDPLRLLHLAFLLGITYAIGQALMIYLEEWTPLAAYGLGVTIVCQLSGAVMKFNNTSSEGITDGKDDATKQEGNTNKIQGNPKKKKRSKIQKEA